MGLREIRGLGIADRDDGILSLIGLWVELLGGLRWGIVRWIMRDIVRRWRRSRPFRCGRRSSRPWNRWGSRNRSTHGTRRLRKWSRDHWHRLRRSRSISGRWRRGSNRGSRRRSDRKSNGSGRRSSLVIRLRRIRDDRQVFRFRHNRTHRRLSMNRHIRIKRDPIPTRCPLYTVPLPKRTHPFKQTLAPVIIHPRTLQTLLPNKSVVSSRLALQGFDFLGFLAARFIETPLTLNGFRSSEKSAHFGNLGGG
jgi:hypothetical protein